MSALLVIDAYLITEARVGDTIVEYHNGKRNEIKIGVLQFNANSAKGVHVNNRMAYDNTAHVDLVTPTVLEREEFERETREESQRRVEQIKVVGTMPPHKIMGERVRELLQEGVVHVRSEFYAEFSKKKERIDDSRLVEGFPKMSYDEIMGRIGKVPLKATPPLSNRPFAQPDWRKPETLGRVFPEGLDKA